MRTLKKPAVFAHDKMERVQVPTKYTQYEDEFLDTRNCIYYSQDVLIGNWFNTRIGFSDAAIQGILPTLVGPECTYSLSTTKDHYGPSTLPQKQIRKNFGNQSSIAFRNYLTSKRSSIKMVDDSDDYLNNFTTTNKLMFETRPQKDEILGEPTPAKKPPEEDILKSYGNLSNFGLREYLHCASQGNTYSSTYRDHYRLKLLPSS